MRHLDIKLLISIIISIMLFSPQSKADVIVSKDTVYGTVIGKNKEPLPGAKVEIVGQSVYAYTDIDGRFRIKCEPGARKVLVSYPKLRDVKKKITPDMTVRIGRSWKQVPEHYQWFVGANIGVGVTSTWFNDQNQWNIWNTESSLYEEYFIAPSISVMAGRVKAVGWYLKGFLNIPTKGIDYGLEKGLSTGAILGGMVRLGCPLHLYLGGGFGYSDLSKSYSWLYNHWGWQIDMGLLFRIKDNYGINLSMNLGMTSDGDISSGTLTNLGFVYFFNK